MRREPMPLELPQVSLRTAQAAAGPALGARGPRADPKPLFLGLFVSPKAASR